jgi:hypothetical protein
MNSGIQVGTLGDSLRSPFGTIAHRRPTQPLGLDRGDEPAGLHDAPLEVDWFRVSVWTAMLSFVTIFWTGMYMLIAWALRLM